MLHFFIFICADGQMTKLKIISNHAGEHDHQIVEHTK